MCHFQHLTLTQVQHICLLLYKSISKHYETTLVHTDWPGLKIRFKYINYITRAIIDAQAKLNTDIYIRKVQTPPNFVLC